MYSRDFIKTHALGGVMLLLLAACAPRSDRDAYRVSTVSFPDSRTVRGSNGESELFPPNPTLADCLRFAALHNAGLEASFQRWKAALARIPQLGALPDPKLTYGYFIEPVETRVGPQRQRFGFAQTFPWFGKLRLRKDEAARLAEIRWWEFEEAKQDLFQRVKETWYELAYLQRAIRITEESVELLKHLESVARAQFRSGRDVVGLVQAQLELGKVEDQLVSLKELRGPLVAQLNAFLNRDLEAEIPWPDDLSLEDLFVVEDLQLKALLDASPTLARLDAEIERADRNVALARKAFYPDLTLGIDYIETGDARVPGVLGSGKDPVMLTGSFQLPLWRSRLHGGVREAEALRLAAQQTRDEQEKRLSAELKMILFKYQDAERRVTLFRDTLAPLTLNGLDFAEKAYQAGQSDFPQLIEAQRQMLDVQLSHKRALIDRLQRLAEIEKLIGGREPSAWAEGR